MTTATFCPHCGFNLKADETVVSGPWIITPDRVSREGRSIRLTPSENIILHSLAASAGRTVSKDVLLERAGSEGERHTVLEYICRLRRKLRGIPIETVWGRGYRWAEPLAEAA